MTAKEALETIKDNFIHNEYGESRGAIYDFGIECCSTIENALNELDDSKHNYKALKEFYDNSVTYAAKLQNELNRSKETIGYLQGEIMRREHRILGLQYEVLEAKETTRPIYGSSIPNIQERLRGLTICEHCHTPIFDHKNRKLHSYCAGCGRKIDKE